MAKPWRDRLNGGKPAHVEILEKPFGGGKPGSRMLVASPLVVDNFIRTVKPGTLLTVADLRGALAAQYGAEISCPISTSIFIRICAEVALEELEMGRATADVTPFWRVIEPSAPLAKKLSCGGEFVARMRAEEAGATG